MIEFDMHDRLQSLTDNSVRVSVVSLSIARSDCVVNCNWRVTCCSHVLFTISYVYYTFVLMK